MFFIKTVDSIIADITKRVAHLRAVAVVHEAKIDFHNEVSAVHADLASAAAAESARAERLATKFEELVS